MIVGKFLLSNHSVDRFILFSCFGSVAYIRAATYHGEKFVSIVCIVPPHFALLGVFFSEELDRRF